jgi:hypothetical protein
MNNQRQNVNIVQSDNQGYEDIVCFDLEITGDCGAVRNADAKIRFSITNANETDWRAEA